MIRGARAAVFTVALTLCAVPVPAQQAGVIPMPAEIKPEKGSFELSAATIIEAPRSSRGAADAARYLADLWQRTNGMTLAVRQRPSSANASADSLIRFEQQPGFGPEAYRVEVAPRRIT